MAVKWICDQTATEETVNDWNDHRYAPKLPDGWVQSLEPNGDGTYTMRHFVSSAEHKNWLDAQP